jgi:hypothetical protein
MNIPLQERSLLYVAAPYTNPDPVLNTHRVLHTANAIIEHTDWLPLVPHLTLLWHAVTPRPIEHWYSYDLGLLRHCDAILRLPGRSTGADAEFDHAVDLGIPAVYLADLGETVIETWRSFE